MDYSVDFIGQHRQELSRLWTWWFRDQCQLQNHWDSESEQRWFRLKWKRAELFFGWSNRK